MPNLQVQWQTRVKFPRLAKNVVHIWYADLNCFNSQQQRFAAYLSIDETQRANRFKFVKHQRRFILTRALLRRLLAVYTAKRAAAIEFTYNSYGKPALRDQGLLFNVSHTKDIALFAFSGEFNLGIDVEYLQAEIACLNLAERFFAPAEVASLQALPAEQQPLGFFNAWTRKEAFVKAVGQGLSYSLKDFVVSLQPQESVSLIRYKSEYGAQKWFMQGFEIAHDAIAAIVVEAKQPKLQFFNLTLELEKGCQH